MEIPMQKKIRDFLLLNAGLFIVSAGIAFFKSPNNFATGGVSGIGIIASHFFPQINLGVYILIINLIFELLGWIFMGKVFALKTLYSTFAISFYVWLLTTIYPMPAPFTQDTMLELIFAIILPAIGSAIVFNLNSSTGGTDILAKILSKYSSIDIGKSLFLSDVAIVVTAGFVFGIRTGLYCVLGLIMKGTLVDLVIDGLRIRKVVTIISCKHKEILSYIMTTVHRGATVYKAYGAYTNKEEDAITTVLSRRQAVILRNYIRSVDPDAFITITNSSEIIGKGFVSI